MEHPVFILAYRKLEPAATWEDILMRMEPVSSHPVTGNRMSMRINRILNPFLIVYTWHGTRDWVRPTRSQRRRLALLSPTCRVNNTTRGFAPGLIDVSRGEQGGRIPLPKLKGKCNGRPKQWLELRGEPEKVEEAKKDQKGKNVQKSGAKRGRPKKAPITVVDNHEDQPCPEFEIDYIAKHREQYPGDKYGDFENQSATSDESYLATGLYPATELYLGTGLDNACHHRQDLINPKSSSYFRVSSDGTIFADATYHTTQDHGQYIDPESSDVYSNICDQPYPTIEMNNVPQHYQEIRAFEASEGQSYTSSDIIFPDQNYRSSLSSFPLDNQHVQAHHLDMPIEYHQKYERIPEHEVQPTMAFPDTNFPLDPRLQTVNIQQTSYSSLYNTQYQGNFPMNGNQDLGPSGIHYNAPALESNGKLQLSGTLPTAPVIGLQTQPFGPGADFQSLEHHLVPPVTGFMAQSPEPKSSFQAFNDQPETGFQEFVNPQYYNMQSNLQLSHNQYSSAFGEYANHHAYEPQSCFNIFNNQKVPDSTLSIAEAPSDVDLMEWNSENNPFPFEKQVHHQNGKGSGFEETLSDHQNPWYY